ncbi:MAG: PQQ-dependent sugar dehydrogenase [Vicinamibacterales bacterium]
MSWSWFRGTPRRGVVAVIPWMTAAMLVSSCGDSKPDPISSPDPGNPTSPGPDPGIVQIRGGERLGWMQSASSLDVLRAHTFRLWVDGTSATLSDTRCGDAAGAQGYECSGRLPTLAPGRHVLEVTSVLNGQQSTRSAPLTVMMLSAAQAQAPPVSELTGGASGDHDAPVLASGLGAISWLSTTPDGRVLFVEDRRAVRVIQDDVLLPQPAHVIDTAGGEIVGLAVDVEFERTRFVYLAATEAQRDGSYVLHISRFRDVGHTLGQRAIIVTGLPVPRDAVAPLGVDGDGFVYVAMPALELPRRRRSDAARGGFVLRFTRDGGVPPTNPQSSPIIAAGFARPSALAIDRAGRRVWVAGTDPSWRHSIASFSIDPLDAPRWAQPPQPGLARGAEELEGRASSLSIAWSIAGAPSVLDLVSRGVVHRATLAVDGTAASVRTLSAGALGAVTAIATDRDGRSYIAVGPDGAPPSSIALLTPR